MATYYKHKATQSRKIPYFFVCEHCMKNSGALTATISGNEAEYDSPMNKLSEKQNDALNQAALKSLKKRVQTDFKNASTKQMFAPAFKDECPHCHKTQSWAISGQEANRWSTPITTFIVGIIISLGMYFFVEGVNLMLSLLLSGATTFIAIVMLVISGIKIRVRTNRAKSVVQKNLPEIDWSCVEDLIRT